MQGLAVTRRNTSTSTSNTMTMTKKIDGVGTAVWHDAESRNAISLLTRRSLIRTL